MESGVDVKDMVDQLFMIGVSTTDVSGAAMKEVEDLNPGAVILTLNFFKHNGSSKPELLSQVCSHVHQWKSLPLIGIDHEGGRIQHLPPPNYTLFPAEGLIGELRDIQVAEKLGAAMGKELRAVGIDWNFAPVLDVSTHPEYHFRHIKRAISGDPQIAADIGTAMINGMQSEGLIACPKHFPGMGATPNDSHYQRPCITLAPKEMEDHLAPYRKAINSREPPLSIMTNHALYPSLDNQNVATLSETILGLSRNKAIKDIPCLNFEGILLTDDLGMAGVLEGSTPGEVAVKALKAGIDMLMFSYRLERAKEAKQAILEALQKGQLDEETIKDRYQRIQKVKEMHKKKLGSLPVLTIQDLPQLAEQHNKLTEQFNDPSFDMNCKTSVGSDVKKKETEKCIIQ